MGGCCTSPSVKSASRLVFPPLLALTQNALALVSLRQPCMGKMKKKNATSKSPHGPKYKKWQFAKSVV